MMHWNWMLPITQSGNTGKLKLNSTWSFIKTNKNKACVKIHDQNKELKTDCLFPVQTRYSTCTWHQFEWRAWIYRRNYMPKSKKLPSLASQKGHRRMVEWWRQRTWTDRTSAWVGRKELPCMATPSMGH